LHIQKWNIPLNEFFQNTEIENFYTIILKSAAGRIWPAGRCLLITGLYNHFKTASVRVPLVFNFKYFTSANKNSK